MTYQQRITVLSTILLAALALIVLRLFMVQIVFGAKYREQAASRILRTVVLDTTRGSITDRSGVVLASSKPDRYALAVDLAQLDEIGEDAERRLLRDLAASFDASIVEIQKQLERMRSTQRYYEERKWRLPPQTMLSGLLFPDAMKVELDPERFPGVSIQADTTRRYPRRTDAAHVLGRTAPMWKENWDVYKDRYRDDPRKKYSLDDTFGSQGLELVFEDALRGRRGRRTHVSDSRGTVHVTLRATPPQFGRDLRLTLDCRIQRCAEEALAATGRPGAAVVMDVSNGELLCLASSPTYDANEPMAELLDPDLHPDRPLIRRATSGLYPPGSTFKVIDTLAGLQSGKLTSDSTFSCTGVHYIGGHAFSCLGHHFDVDLERALARSCNIYFYKAGARVGASQIEAVARKLGLGERTGIEIADEPGICYGPRWLREQRGERWYPGNTANLAIGQGMMLVTPLQMARAVAAVANGGRLLRPHLEMSDAPIESFVTRTIPLSDDAVTFLRNAMRSTCTVGTARKTFRSFQPAVAGKTGTADTGRGTNHGWFVGFVPHKTPKVAFAVVIEDLPAGEHGGEHACPVARIILEKMRRLGYLAEG